MDFSLTLTAVMLSAIVAMVTEVIKKIWYIKGRNTQLMVFLVAVSLTVGSKLFYVNSDVPWFEIVVTCFIVTGSAIGINQTIDYKGKV